MNKFWKKCETGSIVEKLLRQFHAEENGFWGTVATCNNKDRIGYDYRSVQGQFFTRVAL